MDFTKSLVFLVLLSFVNLASSQCPSYVIIPCDSCSGMRIPFDTSISGGQGTPADVLEFTVPDYGPCFVSRLEILINLSHTFNSDLELELVAPDGTRRHLFTDICGNTDDMQVCMAL